MVGSLALVLALSVVSAEHKIARSRAGQPAPATYHHYNGPSGGWIPQNGFYLERDVMEPAGERLSTCSECCEDEFPGLFWCRHSTCDMLERVWYFPESHGYYYFRPYNHNHIGQHQNLATQWGIDPRNPYSNEIFQGIYQTVESRNYYEQVPQPGYEIPSPQAPTYQTPSLQSPTFQSPVPPGVAPLPGPEARASGGADEPVVLQLSTPRKRTPLNLRFVTPAGGADQQDPNIGL